jgi:hypothetical protein
MKNRFKRLRVANEIRKNFNLDKPNHDETMFSLEELDQILSQISSEIGVAMNAIDLEVSHAKQNSN